MIVEEALILLGFDGSKSAKGIKDTKKSITDLNQEASKYGRTLSGTLSDVAKVSAELAVVGRGVGMAINTALVVPNYIKDVAVATRNLDNFSKTNDISIDSIMAMQRAFEQSGVSIETTSGLIAKFASDKAKMLSGQMGIRDVVGTDALAAGIDVSALRGGDPEKAIAVYKQVYDNLVKIQLAHGRTNKEAESYASTRMQTMGFDAAFLPILRMGNDEREKALELEKARSHVTEYDTEEAKRLASAWAKVAQSIDLASKQTARNFTPLAADLTEGVGVVIDELLSESSRIYQGLTHPISDFDGFIDALTPKLNSWVKVGDRQADWLKTAEKIAKQEKERKKALVETNAELDKTALATKKIETTNLSGLESAFDRIKKSVMDMLPVSVINFLGLDKEGGKGTGGVSSEGGIGGSSYESEPVTPKAQTSSAEQKENMSMTYEAYRKQGLSHNQAATMTSEVGRENDFNSQFMFGTHTDKAGGQNIGMISMQGDRNPALREYMKQKGLMQSGKMERSQAAIDAQAAFQVAEMKSGKYPKAEKFLAKPDIERDEASELIGTGYVKWAKHQTRLRNGESFNPTPHLAKEYGYYEAINKMKPPVVDTKSIAQPLSLQPPAVDTKSLANPQPTATPQSSTTNNIQIHVKSTDPTQAAKEIKSELSNISKTAPYSSGMKS